MSENCVPYPRKPLYLIITIPMFALYIAICAYLRKVGLVYFLIYCALFVIVAVGQSYVCMYYACPYIGRFAPCVGGFCLPASRIALLFRNAKKSERTYNISITAAFLAFIGIIVFPIYFLYQLNAAYLLAYLGIVLVYAAIFLGYVCPVCATRHVCPGGQTSTKLIEMIKGHVG